MMTFNSTRWLVALAVAGGFAAPNLSAQVTIHPRTTTPAAWERFAVSVVTFTDTHTVAVRVEVPEAITVLGVEPLPGWTFEVRPPTDSTPQSIEWSGGEVGRGEFRDFTFLGRVMGDARKQDLVFPVRLTRANGAAVDWRGRPGSRTPAPRVGRVGRTQISARGATALAGAAVGIGVLALALSLSRRRSRDTESTLERR